jgi:hypothetical protein
LSTKTIQIPSTCQIASATLSKSGKNGLPQLVTWNANGHNTYTIALPYGYFTGYITPPPRQTTFAITAANGGDSPTLTLDPSAPTGSMAYQVSGGNCGTDEGAPADILVNP